MSTLKTTNLQHASAASPAIVLASDGTATAQLSSLNDGPLSGARNRIINGDMRIDQRNAGAALAVSANTVNYGVDRTLFFKDVTSLAVSLQQSTTAPSGFTNSLGVTVTTAATPTSSQEVILQQNIEGYNVSDLGYGSASAKNTVLSFWVRSSVTGTYCIAIRNSAFNRTYLAEYTILAANTFEYKTISIPGDTSGTWLTDNGVGLRVLFCLGASNTSGSASSWQAGSFTRTANQVNWCATSAATFYITGVQLEAGSVATPFERRSYGQELALCQRYCLGFKPVANGVPIGLGQAYSATQAVIGVNAPVPMRSVPTVTRNGLSIWNAAISSDLAISALTVDANSQPTLIRLDAVSASGLTAGHAAFLQGTSSPSGSGSLILSSEL